MRKFIIVSLSRRFKCQKSIYICVMLISSKALRGGSKMAFLLNCGDRHSDTNSFDHFEKSIQDKMDAVAAAKWKPFSICSFFERTTMLYIDIDNYGEIDHFFASHYSIHFKCSVKNWHNSNYKRFIFSRSILILCIFIVIVQIEMSMKRIKCIFFCLYMNARRK